MPLIGKALALTPEMRILDNPNADTTLGTPTSDTIQVNPNAIGLRYQNVCFGFNTADQESTTQCSPS